MTTEEQKQINQIQHDINGLRQEFKNFTALESEERIKLQVSLDRLLNFIIGDPAEPDRGILARLKKIEDFIEKLERTKSYWAGNIAAGVFIITLLGGLISIGIKLYEYFKNTP